MRYLEYGGRALVRSSTGYFQRRSFTGGFNVVCSLYGTVPGIQTNSPPMIPQNTFSNQAPAQVNQGTVVDHFPILVRHGSWMEPSGMPLVYFGRQAVMMRLSLCEPRPIFNIQYYLGITLYIGLMKDRLCHMKKTLDDDLVFYPSNNCTTHSSVSPRLMMLCSVSGSASIDLLCTPYK